VDLLKAAGWYEESKRREFGCEIWSFPTPDYAGSKQVYVGMGVVKYIKSVVFLLDNYMARKNPATNMFLNIVSGILCHLYPAARTIGMAQGP
jgi:hypothetical protein